MNPVELAMKQGAGLHVTPLPENPPTRCECCGHLAPFGTVAGHALCVTCLPAFALDEYDIDQVATLIWCPFFDQGTLNRLVSALHAVCAQHGTTLTASSLSGEPLAAKRVFDVLHSQHSLAFRALGTDRPSVLREAAQTLPPGHDHALSGIRCLTLDTWFSEEPHRFELPYTGKHAGGNHAA